jgi:predicted DNA-binding transcriptional regulator AlpA
MSTPTLVPQMPRLLTIQQVAGRYGVAVRTIWRWEAQGQCPRGIRVTRGTVRWREDDIEEHVAALRSGPKKESEK